LGGTAKICFAPYGAELLFCYSQLRKSRIEKAAEEKEQGIHRKKTGKGKSAQETKASSPKGKKLSNKGLETAKEVRTVDRVGKNNSQQLSNAGKKQIGVESFIVSRFAALHAKTAFEVS
jgi:hypothetical protein